MLDGPIRLEMVRSPCSQSGGDGEQLRFHGVLTDDVSELVILRFAARNRCGDIWSHHQHPASLAGIDGAMITTSTEAGVPRTDFQNRRSG